MLGSFGEHARARPSAARPMHQATPCHCRSGPPRQPGARRSASAAATQLSCPWCHTANSKLNRGAPPPRAPPHLQADLCPHVLPKRRQPLLHAVAEHRRVARDDGHNVAGAQALALQKVHHRRHVIVHGQLARLQGVGGARCWGGGAARGAGRRQAARPAAPGAHPTRAPGCSGRKSKHSVRRGRAAARRALTLALRERLASLYCTNSELGFMAMSRTRATSAWLVKPMVFR